MMLFLDMTGLSIAPLTVMKDSASKVLLQFGRSKMAQNLMTDLFLESGSPRQEHLVKLNRVTNCCTHFDADRCC